MFRRFYWISSTYILGTFNKYRLALAYLITTAELIDTGGWIELQNSLSLHAFSSVMLVVKDNLLE
jgi:hypothetical protein